MQYHQTSHPNQAATNESPKQVPKQQEQYRPNGPARQGAVYVSRTTQGPPLPKNDKPDLPPLQLNKDKALTETEFQNLVNLQIFSLFCYFINSNPFFRLPRGTT